MLRIKFEWNPLLLVEVIKCDTNYFLKKKYGKVQGWWYFFDLSDLAHIHRVIRIHYGDACYQISEESVVSCWSYKVWHKFTLIALSEKYGKVHRYFWPLRFWAYSQEWMRVLHWCLSSNIKRICHDLLKL